MISVFDMSSGELIHKESCAEQWIDGQYSGPDRGRAGKESRPQPDELAGSFSLQLALLPVAVEDRR